MERPTPRERHEWRHPARIEVAELICSRYGDEPSSCCSLQCDAAAERPLSWDERVAGVDLVKTVGGDSVKLQSSAMQSPPKPGWIVFLTGGDGERGYTWTLYGIPPRCP
jgi:hypothetical protein